MSQSSSQQWEISDARRLKIDIFRIGADALLIGYLFITFIGFRAFSDSSSADRVAGSPLDRIVTFALVALALFVIWGYRRSAWECVRANTLLYAIVGFCQMSAVWATYPDLSLRRALLLVFLTVITTAIAASVTSLRRFHTALFLALGFVIVLNLIGTALWPALAISEIGVKGLYTQKNVAGAVAMMTIIIGVAWISRARSLSLMSLGTVLLGSALLFLILTQSKTSVALTAITLSVGALFVMAQYLGHRFVMLVMTVGLFAVVAFLVVLAASDFETETLLGLVLSDTSLTGRDELWSFAWTSSLQKPWLGYGYGSFWDVGDVNDPLTKLEPGTWLGDVEKGIINQSHNGYLELPLHIGIPATVAAVFYVLVCLFRATRNAIRSGTLADDKAAYSAIALATLAYLFHNVTEASLFIRGIPLFNLMLLLGLLAAQTPPPLPRVEQQRDDVHERRA